MTKHKAPDGEIEAPDISLDHYFDDLLGIGDAIGDALAATEPQPLPVAANAGLARVVSLPTKKTATDKSVSTIGKSSPKPRAIAPQKAKTTDFTEPVLVQTAEQKQQLEKLLQSVSAQLLVEAPAAQVVEPVVQTSSRFVADADEIQDWDIGTSVNLAPEVPAEVVGQTNIETATQAPAEFKMEGLDWLENGRPPWAQSRFDVLLFQVAGLTLAVPLISLGQIQPLTDELTPLFGQADWFMGLQPTAAGKIRTVNTAKFVMPERYDESFARSAKYVMSINGVPWGLAVDSVNQPISLQPDDVKWRTDRGKRPWLAGTVKDHMCALLDIPRIGQLLIESDKNFIASRA